MDDNYKSCDNCYYENFDPFAYPCAMCIRGYERNDKWYPKRDDNGMYDDMKAKQTDELNGIPWTEKDGLDLTDCAWKEVIE